MKLIVFKETGEVRNVHEGEWYQTGFQGYLKWNHVNECIFAPILERIEIEVPERATEFRHYFYGLNMSVSPTGFILLSRPKVKKWLWEQIEGHYITRTLKPMTEEEIEAENSNHNQCGWRKVEGSEVEEY